MQAKVKLLFNLLTFDSQEMRNSYNQYQRDSERVLVSFFNLMLSPVALILLILILISQMPYDKVITRGIAVLASVIAYLLKVKYPLIQKVLLVGIMGMAIASYMLDTEFFLDHVKDLPDRFLLGNGLGFMEIILILSLKSISARSTVFALFTVIKVVIMWKQMLLTQYRNFIIFAIIVITFIFLLIDNILDRRVFKMVFESRDKLKKFQTLLSNDLPSSVVIISSNLDEILYSNDFFRTKFQREDEALIVHELDVYVFRKFIVNRVISKELEEDQRDIPLINFLQNLDTDSSFHVEDAHLIRLSATFKNEEDGELHYEIKLRKIMWEGNVSYAMVLHDVSDKERLMALKIADEQKDKVIATVSHELRTPINGILGLFEMIAIRTIDTVSLEYLDHAKSCSKLLLYLVNSILDLSQLRKNCIQISKSSFKIDRFLDELRSLYIYHSQQKGIDFRIITETSVPKDIYTDKHRLIQILINLLGNAIKFTFQGSITLSISVDKEDPQKVMFCIEDTGIGIKDEDKPKLFKMFGKINHNDKSINSQGAGLGLTIANELVKMLNDDIREETIEFESEYGKGTKFWFRIDALLKSPSGSFCSLLSQKEMDSSDFRERTLGSSNRFGRKIFQYTAPSYLSSKIESMKFSLAKKYDSKKSLRSNNLGSKKHVLLVDDSPFNLMTATFILEQLGYATQKAFNGEDGLNYLNQSQQNGCPYCMILTDIQMPILDGVEMSKIISQKIQKGEIYDVPIVAVTAKKLSDKERTHYKECGIAYAMEKPLVIKDMKIILDKLGLLLKNDTKTTF